MLSKSKIKFIQSLKQKKYRDEAGVFVAEGPKVVREFLDSDNITLEELYIVEGSDSVFTGTSISEADLEKISSLVTPNEVVAIFKKPVFKDMDPGGKISLVLDSIQDPGNLGTIIRTADWFGIGQIFCSFDTVDVFNAKVVQSTMGSIGRVQVVYTELEDLFSKYPLLPVFAASLHGEDLYSITKPSEGFLVIGNESRGISDSILSKATQKVHIPRKGKAESLNASVAAAIILSQFCH